MIVSKEICRVGQCERGCQEACARGLEIIANSDARRFWVEQGGEFFGPNIEMGVMPESKLLPLLRSFITPIPMVLHCPKCCAQHVDAPERDLRDDYAVVEQVAHLSPDYRPWTNPPHRSHLCHACGHIWRPADVPTTGVREIQTRGKDDK